MAQAGTSTGAASDKAAKAAAAKAEKAAKAKAKREADKAAKAAAAAEATPEPDAAPAEDAPAEIPPAPADEQAPAEPAADPTPEACDDSPYGRIAQIAGRMITFECRDMDAAQAARRQIEMADGVTVNYRGQRAVIGAIASTSVHAKDSTSPATLRVSGFRAVEYPDA
jgi:hypothetical protein